MARHRIAYALIAGVLCAPCAALAQTADRQDADAPPGYEKSAPLLDGLDVHHHPISTDVPLAQTYFDQGLVLAFGFNHAEAARSFREAQRLDPDCAMAYWGEALVLGPNINAPMSHDDHPRIRRALRKAVELAPGATPREQDYIEALTARYGPEPLDDRSERDRAYADAMVALADKHPEDYDAQCLAAEALMDTSPWDYWRDDGSPRDATRTTLDLLETVLARRPEHPQANHLYIHTVEAEHPEWGIACADRLRDLVPGAGHLVHMPSHIYVRVGRYADGSRANERAIDADQAYITQCHAQGLYPLGYMPHNKHFLWFTSAMEGRANRSISAAESVSADVDTQKMRQPGLGTLQHFYILPLYAYARFGKWDTILAYDEPARDLKYPRGVWHYARGLAHTRKGDLGAADRELAALESLAADEALKSVTIWDINTTHELLGIAREVLAGEIAAAREDYGRAVTHLRRAVELEARLTYDEPPTWYHPARQILGAVLLEAGRPADAEDAFRADLTTYPDNGWSLYGLAEALRAQGRDEEAAKARKRFEEAWRRADVELTSPRL